MVCVERRVCALGWCLHLWPFGDHGHSATVAGNLFQSAFHETEHSWIVIANTKQLAALDRRFDLATRRQERQIIVIQTLKHFDKRRSRY